MELKIKPWIILLILSITEGAVINNIRSPSSYLIPCEEGWYLFGDKCYKIFEVSKGVEWKSAEISCEVYHGSLVTIQSKELLEFLTTFLLLDVPSNVWIGLNDRVVESSYVWTDGSIVNYTYWESGQPNNVRRFIIPNTDQDCVEMQYAKEEDNWKIGMWNDVECYTKLPFMCEAKKGEQSVNHDPRFCTEGNEGAWKFKDFCYHAVREEKSWDEAENYCQTVLNGHLLTILDFNVYRFLNYVLSDFSKEFWIGIKIRQDAARQVWSSEWIVSYKKWEADNEFVNGTCAYMTENRLWLSAPCTRKLPFVCEVPHVKRNFKQAPEGWMCPGLSKDWVDLGGDTCYIFENKEHKKWHEANFACMKKGGHLASIRSDAESIAIHRRIIDGPYVMLIGLHRSLSDNSVFEWADGTTLDYQNWKPGEPDKKNNTLCSEVWASDMKWNDIPCDLIRGYMCSAKKVPPFFQGSNESALVAGQLPEEKNCLAGIVEKIENLRSSNITLIVFFVTAIILSAVGFIIYANKNQCRKPTFGAGGISLSFSGRRNSESKEQFINPPLCM